jgi:hypothetical protein
MKTPDLSALAKSAMLRVVIDINVLVSALRSRSGASSRPISLLGDPRWRPIVSVALILDYEAVAKREAGRLGLAEWVVDSISDMFCRLGSQHEIRFRQHGLELSSLNVRVEELWGASKSHPQEPFPS